MSRTPRTLHDIDTPAAVIDLDLVRRNIQTLEHFLRDTPVHLRPHVKTHKSPRIALMQIEAGAPGITAAKVGEAEAMVAGGVDDVLIANQIVTPAKIERLARLAERARVAVAVDHPANVNDLSAAAQRHGVTIGVAVEIEVGMRRCGVAAGQPVVDLARHVKDSPGLDLVGLQAFEGHAVAIVDRAEREAETRSSLQPVIESKEMCEDAGIEIREVTGAGTNTFDITSTIPGWTELQCGTYVTMDRWYRPHVGHMFQQAFWVLSSVMSRPTPDLVVLDCGLKSLSTDSGGLPGIDEPEGLELLELSEEHGQFIRHPGAPDLHVCDTVRVTPWHGCTTFNLHDSLYVLQGDEVVDVWPIAARGKFT